MILEAEDGGIKSADTLQNKGESRKLVSDSGTNFVKFYVITFSITWIGELAPTV